MIITKSKKALSLVLSFSIAMASMISLGTKSYKNFVAYAESETSNTLISFDDTAKTYKVI